MPRRNNSIPHKTSTSSTASHDLKRRFATEREALAAAEYQMALKIGLELRVYKCLQCGGWHLTNSNKK